MNFPDFFQRTVIISLPTRSDRRKAMAEQLQRAGLPLQPGRVEFFEAIRPETADGFPNIGARGCFLSHLTVLRDARDRGLSNILVLEDDLSFKPSLKDNQTRLVELLRTESWDIVYLGYGLRKELDLSKVQSTPTLVPVDHDFPILQTHCYAVHGRALDLIVGQLETILNRPPGHALGGPMHVDGALSTIRKQNPHLKTLLTIPELGYQRSSQSDIHALRWFDRTPVVRDIVRLARSAKSRST